jgi:hypothetical protein
MWEIEGRHNPYPYTFKKIWARRKSAHENEGVHWAPSLQLGLQQAEDLKNAA